MVPSDIQAALANHAFEHLFLEGLGWDRLRATLTVDVDHHAIELHGVAEKRGFAVFICHAHRTQLAHRKRLQAIQRQLRKSYHEHILIHACETPRKQVWQWVTEQDGRRLRHREHPFFSDRPPPRLLERIRGLEFTFADEEQTTLTDVLSRVRDALKPEAENDLFAKWPGYAVESDRLAMAIKAGEPGALHQFIVFHMPLARKQSRIMIHWFGMEEEDAQQTAMIGLIEAAKRFEPERGNQFSTYAGHWIRNACQRYGLEWGLPVHVPQYFFWDCYKLSFLETELIATHGVAGAREPFLQALLDAGVSEDQWHHFQVARHFSRFSEMTRREVKSLDRPEEPAQEVIEEKPLPRLVEDALRMLHPRQAEILKLRYGFGLPEHSLQEVADKYGLTRERIRQLQEKAEQKLLRILMKTEARNNLEEHSIYTEEETE